MPSLIPFSARNEFADGAGTWPADLDRRDFVKIMGASAALAGLGACGRAPATLVPYVRQPEEIVPGNALSYATAMPLEGYARGILVEAHEGRPTKIEGNPRQADSLGAADAITQASILSLYDPDRSRTPRAQGQPVSWIDFEAGWLERRQALLAAGGRGFALLTEPTTSPTLLREIHRLLDRFPAARWHQHTPLARYDLAGVQSDCDPGQADVIVAIESDFLHRHPAALRYARAFAQRRRIEHGTVKANRLYALEAGWSLTGAMADHRLAAAPAALRRVLNAVVAALEGKGGAHDPSLTPEERRFVSLLAGDLRRQAPRVLCLAGAEQPAEIHQWVRALNRGLGGAMEKLSPAVRSDADPRCAGDLAALADALGRGEVSTLAVLGSNPAYTGSADLGLAEKLAAVEYSVHLGGQEDETALRCRWHLPESHYLETWGDLRGFGGGAVVQQPLIEPLYGTRSAPEIVRLLADGVAASAYDLVRETWQGRLAGADFEERWTQGLNRGAMEEAEAAASGAPSPIRSEVPSLDAQGESAEDPTLLLRPDPVLADGRWANNGWLQELPRPFTTLVWDNALLVAPGFAAARQLANGDRVRLGHAGRFLDVPIWILPGQAAGCVELHLGGGRSRGGSTGTGRGANAYLLRTRHDPWEIRGISCAKMGGADPLVSTQHHFTMQGRDPARVLTLEALPRLTKDHAPATSLYPAWTKPGHAWGMSIDLSTCFGCSACVVACQAENNIPIVGKEQVSRGREMHWIRIDRYVSGDESNPRMLTQPVACMQCENAPCELVCPVGATAHSSEGLNEMVYNRCVGTRYCSNNCPYKVRRFNFFDFQAPASSPVHLQENPNVTVRARGVMEKCTYCVQRINAGRIAAERDNRPLRDGEIRTACQQACPAEAIVFGDLADPESAVSRRRRESADYALLGELNTRPRTTYLPKIINPAPEPAVAAAE
jgi:molybdopterin-containing oxidoreductase family iron-sulfur binding subunit